MRQNIMGQFSLKGNIRIFVAEQNTPISLRLLKKIDKKKACHELKKVFTWEKCINLL